MVNGSVMIPAWTEGVCGDGAVILRDGVRVSIADVLTMLNHLEWCRASNVETEAIKNLLDTLKSIIATNENLVARIRDLEIRVDQLTRLSEPPT